jgi:hypothetical protein
LSPRRLERDAVALLGMIAAGFGRPALNTESRADSNNEETG